MTTTTSTFTPSTQILEAGEQAQALADAGKALKPFLPQEAQQTIQGVEKVANALNATGERCSTLVSMKQKLMSPPLSSDQSSLDIQ